MRCGVLKLMGGDDGNKKPFFNRPKKDLLFQLLRDRDIVSRMVYVKYSEYIGRMFHMEMRTHSGRIRTREFSTLKIFSASLW